MRSCSDATAKALTAATALGAPVHVLVAGKNARPAAAGGGQARRRREGAPCRGRRYEHSSPSRSRRSSLSLAGPYDAIVAAATTTGKNVMPRVAALLDVMQVSDIIKVVSPDTFERPIYAGNAIQTVQATDAKKVITVRTAAFQPAGEGGGDAPIESAAAAADPGSRPSRARRSPRPTGRS